MIYSLSLNVYADWAEARVLTCLMFTHFTDVLYARAVRPQRVEVYEM